MPALYLVALPWELHSDVCNFNGLISGNCTPAWPLRLHCAADSPFAAALCAAESLAGENSATHPLECRGGGQDCFSAAEISLFNQGIAVNHGTIHGPVISLPYHVRSPPNPPANPAFSAALKGKVQRPRKNDRVLPAFGACRPSERQSAA